MARLPTVLSVEYDVIRFLVGLILLVVGADGLVRGGSALAQRFGISPLMIGLTVVAIGTSAPELVVGLAASISGNGAVAVGSVVGSNIMNILVVLGATALVTPIFVQRRTILRDVPIVFGVSALVLVFSLDQEISRAEGLLLLGGVGAYLGYAARSEKVSIDTTLPNVDLSTPRHAAVLATLAGITLLAVGGDFVVDGGTGIAKAAGLPDHIIALTLVAIGTSAPELATSIMAALRRNVDLAVGNIVGSNILNLLLVLGASGVMRPLPVPDQILRVDMVIMLGATLLLYILINISSRLRVGRRSGSVLLAGYAVYVGLLLGKVGPFG